MPHLKNRTISIDTSPDIWPGLVDVIISTLMILLLFMTIQYLSFYLSDALKRMEVRGRQDQVLKMISEMETLGEIGKGVITIETSGDRQILRFSSELVFETGQYTIPQSREESIQFLDALGKMILSAYYERKLFDQIFIEGHTDTDPILGGGLRSNWDLSARRALYITEYFISKGFLKPVVSRERFLGVAGYGEFNNIQPNDSTTGKAANRRIEILLMYSAR